MDLLGDRQLPVVRELIMERETIGYLLIALIAVACVAALLRGRYYAWDRVVARQRRADKAAYEVAMIAKSDPIDRP